MTSAPVRIRYGRLGAAGASLVVSMVAVLGGLGVLPTSAGSPPATSSTSASGALRPAAGAASSPSASSKPSSSPTSPSPPVSAPSASVGSSSSSSSSSSSTAATALPARSGHGRRVVYSQSRQRVWLVDADGTVRRTYLVSGSVYDNLHPGHFRVYSRSVQAWGIDDSGTMRLFVRFTQGTNHAAIGFHTIPIGNDGKPLQTVAQLGTPQSHGCIRQRTPDARALWDFAPIGTPVVVV